MGQSHCDFQCYQFGVAPLFSCDSVFQTTMCTGHAKLWCKQSYVFKRQFIRQFYTTILYYNFENCCVNLSDSLDRYTCVHEARPSEGRRIRHHEEDKTGCQHDNRELLCCFAKQSYRTKRGQNWLSTRQQRTAGPSDS